MGLIIAGILLLVLAYVVRHYVDAPFAEAAAILLAVGGLLCIVVGLFGLLTGGTTADADLMLGGPILWLFGRALRLKLPHI